MKAKVFSHRLFNKEMESLGWNDGNVPDEIAIVSIVTGTKLDFYPRHFNKDEKNVITVEMFDITQDYDNVKALTLEEAKPLSDFITSNIGKTFYIHCWAGKSRSQAVAKILQDLYNYEIETYNGGNFVEPNTHIYNMIKSNITM